MSFKEQLKEHKVTLILTLIVTLIPMVAGFVLWTKLPDVMATHFNASGEADGWSSKVFTIVGLPLMLVLIDIIIFVSISLDPKKSNISGKFIDLMMWIVPLTSLMVGAMIYSNALNLDFDSRVLISAFLGLVFIILGLGVSKNDVNYTAGFKTPWALNDPENWKKTNKLGGKCFVIGGLVLIATCWLSTMWILIAVLVVASLIPVLYSLYLFKKS